MLEFLIAFSVLVNLVQSQGQDLTIQTGTNGSAVVSACISRLQQSGIFTSDKEMLRRIAYVETNNGNDDDTYRSNYHGGIWAVDEDLFGETQDTASYSTLTSLHQSIESTFSIDWSTVVWNDLRKPLYSALAARLYFYTVSESIPISSNVQAQATYWVTYYNTAGSTSTFVTLVNELLALDDCSVSGLDIYFVMDDSGSVGSPNFQSMKQFVYNTANEFDIGADETQVGVISFSSSAQVQFYLNTYHDKSALLAAINNLPYRHGGNTYTADGINLLEQSGFTSANGGRPLTQAIPRVAVVITDGQSNNASATAAAAQSAHDAGITILAVGIGSNVDNDELTAIASDPSYVSTITGFDTSQFDALQTTITNEACTTSAGVEINETVNTSVGEGETSFIEIPYDSDKGVTIKVNVTNGTITVYASYQTTTPNEAFYDWMIGTDGYSDVFLDPDDVNRTIGDTVYVAIEGEDTDNDFTFVSEEGDTTETPAAPVNVTIGTITATTVTISWTPPASHNADDITRYDLELSEEQFGLPTLKANSTGTSITVTGLEEHNTYACKVAAVSRSNVGMFSSSVIFTTLESAPSAAPQSPTGTALSSTVITLEWDSPPAVDINGDIEYYLVEAEEVYTGRMWTFHAVDVHINIGSLHAYYVYSCRVAAFTIELGPFTNYYNVYSGEKAPKAAPENVTVLGDSPSSVDLAWDAPPYEMQNGRIRHYNVEITEDETGNALEFTTNYTNITIDDLVPFYNYTCTVSAETIANGPSSDEIAFVLPEGAPDGVPENVTGKAISSTSIEFNWDPPERKLQNGYIVEYRVRVTETDTGTVSTMNVTNTSLSLTSLHPYYVYSFSVAAVTVGIGPYSTAINTTTDEDVPTGAPLNFTTAATSPFKADLSWMPPLADKQNGVIISYVINITEDDTGDNFQVSTSITSITIDDNLRPYYTYTCIIAAENSVGVGPFSSNVSFTTHEYVPSEVMANVSRRDGRPNELLVVWTVPESPNGVVLNYTVYCDISETSASGDMLTLEDTNTTTVVVSGNLLSVVVTGLTPYTYYDCYVTANTSVGEGNASIVESAQTDESEPGDAPTDFGSMVVNSTAIRLTWDSPLLPYGIILSYTVTYNTSDGDISLVENSTDPRDIIVANLQEHTWYRFEIVASTRVGSGPSAYLTTRTDISEPHAPPSNITFVVDSSTQATISWQPPPFEHQNGPILYYTLIIYELVFGLDDVSKDVTALSYTVTGLEENNSYSFIIAAATREGIGPYSTEINFTTGEDIPSSPPTSVTGDVQSSTLVVFSWLPPPTIDHNGVINYYVVRIREIETNTLWTFFAVDEDISVGSLHPFYYYDCTVAAHTSVGRGPFSTAIRVQTEEAAPSGPPLSLESQKTSTSLTLSWNPPSNDSQNGIVRQYHIQIVENDTSTTTTYISNITQITVGDLHPYYVYKCSVAAETVGVGPYTTDLIVQLDEDSPSAAPVNPNGSSPTSTSIYLSWGLPPAEHRNGVIRSYIINSTELETNNTFSYTSLNTSLTINALHPYYRYRFTISAVTISTGPPTAAFTVRTQEDAPSSPVRNSLTSGTTSTSVSLRWEPPADDQRNGIIVVYVIRIISVDAGTTFYLNSTTTSVTIMSLSPYTVYDCSIAAATSAGRGPFSSAITVRTDEAAPSVAPQNLAGVSVNSRAISLSWSPPPASGTNGVIREYRINVTEVETQRVFTLTSTTTSIAIQSLHPYYTYSCVVSAYTVGYGPYTTVFNITTPEDVPTGYPQSFSVSATSSRSALLTWDPPEAPERNGIVIEYTINVSAVETGEEFQLTSVTTSITVTSLRPYTTYQCVISASTSVGMGPFSTVFTVRTPEDVPTSAPQDPSGYAISSSSMSLSWSPPPVLETHGIIREYRINITEQETGTLTTYTSYSTSIDVSLLHPYYTYHWIVTAFTIGEGPYTTFNSVRTLEDVPSGPPLNFSAEEVLSRSFTLTWDPPAPSERNGNITGYNISVTSLNSLFEDPQLFFTTSNIITVNDLDPHTDYICIIAANTAIGIGPFSLEITVQTEQDVPGAPPSNTTGDAVNSTHVHLTWDPPPPDQINGVIQGYRINITELNTGEMSQHIAEDTEATIGPLHPHYNYNFSIVAFTLAGHGPTTYVIVRTAEAAPSSPPRTFQATATSATSIFLSWTPPPLEDQNGIIRHYEVTLVALETREIHIRTSVEHSINVTSLRPYITYNCTVAAETVATGPTTIGIIVQTHQTAPSAPPEEVQVSAENSRTLRLRWQPPDNSSRNGVIQRYHINITETNTGSSLIFETPDQYVVVDNLHPFYQYRCIVAAETVGLGPFSTAVIIQLPEDAPSSYPVGVSISLITSTSFSLSWSAPPAADWNGIIRHYLISIIVLETGEEYSYSSVTTEFNAEFLHPYYYYNCSVSAVTITAGPYSYPVTLQTGIDVPSGPPQSTDTPVILSMAILLTWDLPLPEQQNGPIVGYTVRVVRVNGGNTTDFATNSTMLVVPSLDPYTLYEWRVAAETVLGTGPFSGPLTVQTLPDAPDDAPQDISAVNVESRVIELAWSPPPAEAHNGEIVNYIITYTEVETGRNNTVTSFNTDISLGNLHPFYNYIVTIAAFTVDIGPPSNPFTVQTLEDAPSAPPTDVSAIALSATELNIMWQPPVATQQNGIIRSYILTVSIVEVGTSEQLTSNSPQLIIHDLHPFYTYSFLIAAVTIRPGPFSDTFSIQMPPAAPVSPPLNITVDIVSSESISVTWAPSLMEDQNGIITSYSVRVYSIVTGETTVYLREGHHSQIIIDSLHPYYEYDVSIAAETVGIGPFSTPQRVRTLQDIPSAAPQNMTVTAVTSRSILVNWLPLPMDSQNGVILHYRITVSVRESRESFVLFSQDTQLVFDVAHPFYTYTFAVAAETIGTGPFGEEVTIVTPEDVPTGVPQFLVAEAVSSSSIRITWAPPPEEQQNGVIRSYYINVTEVPTGSVREMVAHGDESIEIVNQLHPYYLYTCAVAAYTVGLGPAAFTQALTYPAVPSDVPLDVIAMSLNATHAMLSWEPPLSEHRNGPIRLYHIITTSVASGEELQDTSANNWTVIGPLHPFYTYKFSVAAETVEVGPFTTPVVLQMPEAAPSGILENILVNVTSARSVTVYWLPPDVEFWNGVITSYTVVYDNMGTQQGDIDEENSGLAPFTSQTISIPRPGQQLVNSLDPQLVSLPLRPESVLIEQLEEYHLYSFAIYQENAEGVSMLSEAVSQEMPEAVPSGSPRNIEIDVQSSTSVIVMWKPPKLIDRNGIIIRYNLIVTFVSNNTIQRYPVPATVLAIPIEGLQKYSIVSVQIAAETSAGIGPYSATVSALTEEDVPSPPKQLESKIINDTALSLSWITPDSPNGIILEYQVTYYGYTITVNRVTFFLNIDGYLTFPQGASAKKEIGDANAKKEIVDGPKVINVPAKVGGSPVYTLIISDLVAGLTYEIKLRARTSVGHGENITVTLTTSLPPTEKSQGSSLSNRDITVIVLVIVAIIGWIAVAIFVGYFVRRRYTRRGKYGLRESTVNKEGEVYTNSNPLFELQTSENDMRECEEDDDIDEKPPLDQDATDQTTQI